MNIELYHFLTSGGSAWIQPHRAAWKLTGADRHRFLNGQVTNNINALKPGSSCYAAVTTAKGKMSGDVWVHATSEMLLMDADVSLKESLSTRLEKYLISDDAELSDASGEWRLIHWFGSRPENLSAGSSCAPSRRYGLPGWDVWQSIADPLPEGAGVDEEVLEVIRIEYGLPRWGIDMGEETFPPEAGLQKTAIRYDKGCYIGQEVISRLKSVGHVNRELRVMTTETTEQQKLLPGSRLSRDGKEVGRITSVCASPKRGGQIALGYVPYGGSAIGEMYRAGDIALTIIDPPLS